MDAVFKVLRSLDDHSKGFVQRLYIVRLRLIRFLQKFRQSLCLESKLFTEDVSRPLDAMQGLLGKHFQSAVRDLPFLNWVVLTAVALSRIRDDYLDVSFGPKGSRLKQRYFILNASLVDVSSSCNVVQSVSHNSQALKEFVAEYVFGGV